MTNINVMCYWWPKAAFLALRWRPHLRDTATAGLPDYVVNWGVAYVLDGDELGTTLHYLTLHKHR